MSVIKELKEEDLEKISCGDEDPEKKEETALANVCSKNLPYSYYVYCPFCEGEQYIGSRWGSSNTLTLPCGCKLEVISMTSVRITKHQS